MERKADLLGAPAYPGDSPQATSDREQEAAGFSTPAESVRPDYTVAEPRDPDIYNWAMSGTHVAVSDDSHGDQFSAMGWTDFGRPHAYGKVELHSRWSAYWHVIYTNMSLHIIEKRLKRYTKDQGWDWGGILDDEGLPMESQSLKQASVPGIGEINPGLKDWKNNEWAGLSLYDNPAEHQTDTPFYGLSDPVEDMPMTDPRTCSECGELMLSYDAWRKHVLRNHVNPERKPPNNPQPVVDLDDVLPAGFNEAIMDKTVQRQSRLIYQFTAARPREQLIQGPMPFIYDIESDRIFVGHPGERHSDIKGQFTPGGIIEGLYDPKGSVQIRTDTDMPYTVRHMAELWYALHPELQIKSIFLMVGEKKYKLASANIGHQVRNLVATDPAAWAVYQALEPLGNVYVVGGAVRDVVLGKTPKDIDLMIQGVEPEDVGNVLEQLPGRVDYTGKQFGVFRYRSPEGDEVEVALPRTERSTGPGHRDFEVYTNPFISVGEDLGRRDFTGNAMAVNLSTGDLVDPYHGSEDLKSGTLSPVSDRTFLEDPLRILRAFSSVSRHGLDPSPATYHDLAAHAGLLSELPRERLQMELDKLMAGDDPAKAIDLMEATDVLQHVLPEVAATTGFDQKNPHHAHTLGEHLKAVLKYVASQTGDLDLRWAALLHDIGKPASQWVDADGVGHYYKNELGQGDDHDRVGANMAVKLLSELKFPTDRIERISHLIRHHMFPAFSSQAGARKFINRVGDEHANDLLTLRQADVGGKGMDEFGQTPLMGQYVERVRQMGEPTDKSMLAINGNDLIAAGFKPGPEMGQILNYLTEVVLEDPRLNTPEALLDLAQNSRSEPHTGNTVKFFDTKTLQMLAATDNYIEELAIKILNECTDTEIPDEGRERNLELFRAYALLALTKGKDTTAEDVHDAWAMWRAKDDPDHKSLIPFDELTEEVKAYDEPYVRYIHKHAHIANILDPIRDELDPDVFNNSEAVDPVVKPKITEWVKRKIYKTMMDAGWPDPSKYLTLILTGSLTTYQWGPNSDFDTSLWVDVERFPEWVRADLIALMIEKCDGTIVPGTTHPIQCFVVDPIRFKKEDLYKPGLRSGYNLDEAKWLILPERSRTIDVSKQWPEHVRYAKDCADKMKMMLRYDKYAVKTYWDFLHRQRFLDMRAGRGDYAISNIVYKMLANEGLLDEISDVTGEHIA